jgi:hypothetical protein
MRTTGHDLVRVGRKEEKGGGGEDKREGEKKRVKKINWRI